MLENYQLLATRNKTFSDRAMQSFIEMLEEESDYLPAILGMATGFMMEKNQVRDRYFQSRLKYDFSRSYYTFECLIHMK